MCTVHSPKADYRALMLDRVGKKFQIYKVFYLSVIVTFGGPEIKAQVAWQGPVSIFFSLGALLMTYEQHAGR